MIAGAGRPWCDQWMQLARTPMLGISVAMLILLAATVTGIAIREEILSPAPRISITVTDVTFAEDNPIEVELVFVPETVPESQRPWNVLVRPPSGELVYDHSLDYWHCTDW